MSLSARRFGFVLALALAVAGCTVADLLTQPDSQPDEGLAIKKFTASSKEVTPGAAVTLSWEVVGASSIELDNGIGTVAAKGSHEVRPTATTIYTIGARSDSAAAANSVRVTVR